MRLVLAHCALALLAFVSGCRLMNEEAVVQGTSPLRPANPSPDSVQMEVIWARCPLDDAEINDTVWAEIDETQVAPAVHRELARNGFRVGVISTTPPAAIARLLNMEDATTETDTSAASLKWSNLLEDTKIHGSRRNLRRGDRMEICASENMPEMTLLVSRGQEFGGRTFRDAQAIYALRIEPQTDQTVKVELTPEIHFGQSQMRWSGGAEGMDVVLRQLPMRDREVFESMRLEVKLAPGEMLMLTGLPDNGSRAGHVFHTAESSTGSEQKVVLIRLAQVPESDTFAQTAARSAGF